MSTAAIRTATLRKIYLVATLLSFIEVITNSNARLASTIKKNCLRFIANCVVPLKLVFGIHYIICRYNFLLPYWLGVKLK